MKHDSWGMGGGGGGGGGGLVFAFVTNVDNMNVWSK